MYLSINQSVSQKTFTEAAAVILFTLYAVQWFAIKPLQTVVFIVLFSSIVVRCNVHSFTIRQCLMGSELICCRPTSRGSGGNNMNNNGGLQVGIADDQAKDFDFEKTEMKYDSTGMFHWGPAKNLEECILVSWKLVTSQYFIRKVVSFIQYLIVICHWMLQYSGKYCCLLFGRS